MVNYKNLRPNNLTSPEFKHILLLIYWPFYGLTFWFLERGITLDYTPIVSKLDAHIPFCELFVPPYYFWFLFILGIHIYTFFFDVPAFKKLMYFIIITYTLTTIIYIVFPNKQDLRITDFPRDNILIDIVKGLYVYDTNTNVCPSLHVVGSFAVFFTAINCEKFKKPVWFISLLIVTVIISISTVFLKQHSIIDVWAALALCFISYPFAYIIPDKINKTKSLKRGEPQAVL